MSAGISDIIAVEDHGIHYCMMQYPDALFIGSAVAIPFISAIRFHNFARCFEHPSCTSINDIAFCTLLLAPTNRVTAAFSFIDTDNVPGSSPGATIFLPLASF